MAKIEIIPLFPAAEPVDLKGLPDNDPPVNEAIEIHVLQNARVNNLGYVFKNGQVYEHFITPRHRGTITWKNVISTYLRKKTIKVDFPIISVAHGWYDNYYHFSLEVLIKIFLLSERYPETTIVFPKNLSGFHKQWFELLGINNFLFIDEKETIKSPKVISCNFPNRDLNHHEKLIDIFRTWIFEKTNSPIKALKLESKNKLFIDRSKAQKRRILNHNEVIQLVKENGYQIIDLEDYTVLEQLFLFKNAKKIVAVHGASLTNTIFCEENTQIIDLIHEEYKVHCFLKLGIILNLNYEKIECSGNKKDELPGYRDLSINILDLKEKL